MDADTCRARLLDYASTIIALSDEARGAALDEARKVGGHVAISGGIETCLCAWNGCRRCC